VEHIISACQILAKEIYIQGDDRVSAQLHFNMCLEVGGKTDNKHWYDHVSKSVETSYEGNVTVLWIQKVRTERTIPNNKPDNL
jgi:hypothetical protein